MKICIYTQKTVEGEKAIPIKEDRIIHGIRAIKKIFGVAQNNELFVSEAYLQEHTKRRKSFEKSMLFASVLAGLVFIAVLYSIVSTGRFEGLAILSAFVIGGFILSLPLFKYSPGLSGDTPKLIGASSPAKATKPNAAAKPKATKPKAVAKPKKPANKNQTKKKKR
ncbi:MAG: hypothetical protein ABH983_04470 [Candidatus Micrarchaeota archaeon]|nr:hypothetical protein [Candidatus Micrarchaeota archaeon]MBU1681854.1 hypothetical protein [Candidatus Micrarchaeota archaeon]